MGQGQSDAALEALRACLQSGGWLCLQNVHLVTSWLPVIESELSSRALHPNFRLWLTTEPHPKFPSILLQNSLKLTVEAPPG
jgi:dynein heavy chain 2